MNTLRVFVGRDGRRGDNSRVMKVQPRGWRSLPSLASVTFPSCCSHPSKRNATVGSNWLDKYLNCLKCCCFGFYTFSRGFSLLQRASFWVCWPVLPLGPAVQFLFVHGPVLCTSSQSPQDLLRLWILGLRSLFCDFVNLSDAYLKLCIHFEHSREFDLSWSQFLFATLYVLCI